MEIHENGALIKYYEDTRGNFSCQPFLLYHLPDKKINIEKLLSQLKGDLKVEQISIDDYKIFDEFKSENDELLKKITVVDDCLINRNSGLILITHEKERQVFFRNKKYLFIDSEFVLLNIELIKETYYLYIFAKKDSIKALIDILPEKLNSLGLQIGELLLSKNALFQLHDELGGNLTQFSLNNVTSRLKTLRGSGTELQKDDTFKDLKDKPTTEVYRYLFEIEKPFSNLTLDKFTVSIIKDCFVHSYSHVTYSILLDFIKKNVLPKATAKVVVQHPLSAYDDKLEIYDSFESDEEET